MKSKSFLWVVFVLGLIGCHREKPGKQPDSAVGNKLKYSYKVIKKEDKNCSIDPDVICSEVDIKYPVFSGQAALNNTIMDNVAMMFGADKSTKDPEQLSLNFISSAKKDIDKAREQGYTLDGYIKVLRQDPNLITLETGYASYTGGAHGAEYTAFINWDVKNNKNLGLNDLLIDGYTRKLTDLAEKIFRKQENLSDTASLANNYLLEDNKFKLASNFLLTSKGIQLLYNDYEIKPYSEGQTELLIPYSRIKLLIRPNTVLTDYIQ